MPRPYGESPPPPPPPPATSAGWLKSPPRLTPDAPPPAPPAKHPASSGFFAAEFALRAPAGAAADIHAYEQARTRGDPGQRGRDDIGTTARTAAVKDFFGDHRIHVAPACASRCAGRLDLEMRSGGRGPGRAPGRRERDRFRHRAACAEQAQPAAHRQEHTQDIRQRQRGRKATRDPGSVPNAMGELSRNGQRSCPPIWGGRRPGCSASRWIIPFLRTKR